MYLIGCAYHYIEFSMRDIIQVVAGATPGPTASPGPGGYAPPRRKARPALTQGEPQLIDQRGQRFTLASLRGEPLIVTFVSAHCTDACPLINAQFAEAAQRHRHDRLAAQAADDHSRSRTRFAANDARAGATLRRGPTLWLVAGGSRSTCTR